MGGLQLQMSWQPSLLNPKRKNGPPLGLRNLGNSCYLNSVLQCLTYTPPLANFCLRLQHSSLCDLASNGERKHDCPFCVLEKRIVRSLRLDLTLDNPAKIQSCLRIFAEHFRCGHQEDAHEFLRYVIDACHNTCLRLKKLRRKGTDAVNDSTVVKDIFGGSLQSQVKCLSCNFESNKVDDIMDVSLDVFNSNSLKEAMQKFFQPEILDGNNKYKCENCKKLVAARKQMSILQAPNILVIQLKRFQGIFGGKIDKVIGFEEVLVLSSFMCKASQDPQPEYKLFGTIVHSGYSAETGHYYAYIKDAMGQWYCCNDSYVTLSTLQDVLSEKVYILFFSRSNHRPTSASTTLASNGVKSCNSSGSETSTNPRASATLKAVPAKPYSEKSSGKYSLAMSKVDQVPSNPQVKFKIVGNCGSKRIRQTIDSKIDVHNGQNGEMHEDTKDSVHIEKIDKDISSVVNRNGLDKSKNINVVDGEACQPYSIGNENSGAQSIGIDSVKINLYKSNGTMSKVIAGSGPGNHELQNGSVNCHSDVPGSKRKSNEDSCSLLAQDAQSQAKLEELKKVLEQEASSVLQSCGWSDKVYSSMHLRKKLCAHENGNTPSGKLKKLMIADAKRTLIPQIPESLKEDLIKRLRKFSQRK